MNMTDKGKPNLFLAVHCVAVGNGLTSALAAPKPILPPFSKAFADQHFPTAECIHMVLDNLNIHTPAVLHNTFLAPKARHLASWFIFRFSLKYNY